MPDDLHSGAPAARPPAGVGGSAPSAAPGPAFGYDRAGSSESVAAKLGHWDGAAADYLDEHRATLGTDRLVWGPEGLDEERAGLLGPAEALRGAHVLEVGCGMGQGARWAASVGAVVVGVDLSGAMLARSRELDAQLGTDVPVLQADARRLPLADGWADVAFSAYGALPFVADPDVLLADVARVLRPGGRWVFSLTHPVRWGFPDVPGAAGLTAGRSYFDRRPYVERDEDGVLRYTEHHRTLGDWVGLLTAAGFVLEALHEPEWPVRADGREQPTWGGWSALRGLLLPGTAVFACRRAPSPAGVAPGAPLDAPAGDPAGDPAGGRGGWAGGSAVR